MTGLAREVGDLVHVLRSGFLSPLERVRGEEKDGWERRRRGRWVGEVKVKIKVKTAGLDRDRNGLCGRFGNGGKRRSIDGERERTDQPTPGKANPQRKWNHPERHDQIEFEFPQWIEDGLRMGLGGEIGGDGIKRRESRTRRLRLVKWEGIAVSSVVRVAFSTLYGIDCSSLLFDFDSTRCWPTPLYNECSLSPICIDGSSLASSSFPCWIVAFRAFESTFQHCLRCEVKLNSSPSRSGRNGDRIDEDNHSSVLDLSQSQWLLEPSAVTCASKVRAVPDSPSRQSGHNAAEWPTPVSPWMVDESRYPTPSAFRTSSSSYAGRRPHRPRDAVPCTTPYDCLYMYLPPRSTAEREGDNDRAPTLGPAGPDTAADLVDLHPATCSAGPGRLVPPAGVQIVDS
ncbi:uncharacterized protein N7459_004188 [Penicillium hispanicum]|uniref:uncharacterized protein n=1 Tax=Penicillium hispanicum TaxID=1080232 RepID=UPI002540F1E0|nr:uncharacterized protein N7459_004188 [Penicillium hispanicum]KAJ5584388.1 hypothetical protein N7459_004188 [Penicillium hispanicum]